MQTNRKKRTASRAKRGRSHVKSQLVRAEVEAEVTCVRVHGASSDRGGVDAFSGYGKRGYDVTVRDHKLHVTPEVE
eukprot:21091-Rhodomonas_salina.1